MHHTLIIVGAIWLTTLALAGLWYGGCVAADRIITRRRAHRGGA